MQNARSGTRDAQTVRFPLDRAFLKCTTVCFCLSELHFFCFCAFFTLFCFELAFGVNMEVLDKNVGFPAALV